MRKRTVSLLLCWLISLTFSCERTLTDTSPDGETSPAQLIKEAQQYFTSRLVANQQSARLGDGKDKWIKDKQPQWDKAETFKADGKEIVEVPLLFGGIDAVYTLNTATFGKKGVIKEANGVSKALFVKQKDGTMQAFVMRLVSDMDYLSKSKSEYKKLSFNRLSKDFSGFVFMMTWADAMIDSYRLEDGKVIASTRPTPTGKNGRKMECSRIYTCNWVCIGIGNPCCTPDEAAYNPTGNCCANGVTYCYNQCYFDWWCVPDPVQVPTTPPGGTGPTNPTDPGSTNNVVDFAISLSDPCFLAATDRLFNSIGAGTEILGEDIWNIIYAMVPASTPRRIFIEQAAFDPNTDAVYLPGGSNSTIQLNTNALALASEEYVAVSLIHEIIHGYYQQVNGRPLGNDADHINMAAVYVQPMAQAIVGLYGISSANAEALAWGGLQDTPQYQSKTAAEKSNIIVINGYYRRGISGTRCR